MDGGIGSGERFVQACAGGNVGRASLDRIGPSREAASGAGDGDHPVAASTRCGTRWLPTNPVAPTIAMFMHPLSALFLLLSRRTFLSATVKPMPSTTAPHGMVVTPHPLATAAGVDALRAGGSAVDAAVAANAMLAVVYCNACGLGGDAFALVWDPGERRLHGFNGSGRSPAGLTIDAVRAAGHAEMPARGRFPSRFPARSTPGSSCSTDSAAAPLPTRCAPLPDRGRRLRADRDQRPRISRLAPRLRRRAREGVRTGPARPATRSASRCWPRHCARVAEGGRDAYYGGPIGAEIARAIQAAGGVMTADDIAEHRGDWVEPISTRYRDVEVATIPPNSQGITGLMALNVLSTLDWPMGDPSAPIACTRRSRRSRLPGASGTDASADPDRGLADPADCSPASCGLLASRAPERAQRFVPTNPRAGHHLSVHGRCRRHDGQPHPVELHGVWLRDNVRPGGDHAPEPRSVFLARSGPSQRARSPARAPFTRSCRGCFISQPRQRSRSARWVAMASRRRWSSSFSWHRRRRLGSAGGRSTGRALRSCRPRPRANRSARSRSVEEDGADPAAGARPPRARGARPRGCVAWAGAWRPARRSWDEGAGSSSGARTARTKVALTRGPTRSSRGSEPHLTLGRGLRGSPPPRRVPIHARCALCPANVG